MTSSAIALRVVGPKVKADSHPFFLYLNLNGEDRLKHADQQVEQVLHVTFIKLSPP